MKQLRDGSRFFIGFLSLAALGFSGPSFTSNDSALKIPPAVKQGNVLTIDIPASMVKDKPDMDKATAWLAGRQIPLFLESDGHVEGLMPIPVDLKPKDYPLKIQSSEGQTLFSGSIRVMDAHFSRQNIEVSKKVGGLTPEPGELETIGALKAEVIPEKHWERPFASPTSDCLNGFFGVLRYHNGVYIHDYHKGVDLRAPMGRPIHATASGIVRIARFYRLDGGTVGIDHGQGVSSIYIHMSKIDVKPGELVRQGQVIGNVGSTGFATGPHLHWGLYVNGLPVNPLQWLPPVNHC